jgi:glycosyltransferase involved in cell wall biosynthesis
MRTKPGIALVTPSYNQGAYLEQTLRSVLDQHCEELEYVVVDGGSSDASVSILEEYSSQLDGWNSGPDRGMYDALNLGFTETTAPIMGWLNSDDLLLPGSLAAVLSVFRNFPEVEWMTTLRPARCGSDGRRFWTRKLPGFHRRAFLRGEYVVGATRFRSGWIPQESTFWRRSLWERAGGCFDLSVRLAGDFDLWQRFYHHADLVGVDQSFGVFRLQPEQQTAVAMDAYVGEVNRIVGATGEELNTPQRSLLRKVVTRLPEPLRRPLVRAGLAYESQVIVPRPEGWEMVVRAV